jgi:hypothetical protein
LMERAIGAILSGQQAIAFCVIEPLEIFDIALGRAKRRTFEAAR